METPENSITEFFMPCGDDVIPLLSQPSLTDAFIRGLLRERGVLTHQVERTQLIEHFVLSYLSASEFEAIMDRLTTREDSLKLRTVSHRLTTQATPLATLTPRPNELNLSEMARDPNGNYQIEGSPFFARQQNGDFALNYSLRRPNAGRNWIKSQERYTGKVILRQSEDLKTLLIKSYHSSSETKTVNQAIKRWLRNDLQAKNIITSNSEKSIEFGDFSNEARMLFFLKFTGKFPNEQFTFDKVTDFDFRVDDQLIPSEENRLIWMKGAVSRSSLKGKALHDVFILKERSTWNYVKIWFIELRFKITTADFEGNFSLILEFDGYGHSNSPTCKFQFYVGSISSRKYSDSTELARKRTQERIDTYVQKFADEALTSASVRTINSDQAGAEC